MYPNLRAELARKGITVRLLAKKIGMATSTLSLKLSGKSSFTLEEAIAIKQYLNDVKPFNGCISLEVLFERAE